MVKFSPIYQFVQALRQSYAGQMAIGTYVVWMGAMTAIGFALLILSVRRFSWMPEQGV
ncbi:hypothetical protein [Verminephrobacter eiseniae]|uniref:hypothetical protein n=1 Tax=Verminephrobacter eiseniae TaxID=364317 RepID=UPI002238F0C7|nr:hypothetical protein [Verminephrobacter eiseniae]